jgi:hypothetical protein
MDRWLSQAMWVQRSISLVKQASLSIPFVCIQITFGGSPEGRDAIRALDGCDIASGMPCDLARLDLHFGPRS